MRTDKEKALSLRSKNKSYREIQKEIEVSLSTLSRWFKENPESKSIFSILKQKNTQLSLERIQNINASKKALSASRELEWQRQAKIEFEKRKDDPLFIAGISLYLAHGDKASRYKVGVSSADPILMALFRSFLISLPGVQEAKIKNSLILRPGMDDRTTRWWLAALPRASFSKSVIVKKAHSENTARFGICRSWVMSRELKVKMLDWVRFGSERLIRDNAGMV